MYGTSGCVSHTGCPRGERFVAFGAGRELAQQLLERVGDVIRRRPESHAMSDAAPLAETAANEEVEAFHLRAADVDHHALKADVGDRMLTTRVGASGDVQLDGLRESGQPILELLRQPDAPTREIGRAHV